MTKKNHAPAPTGLEVKELPPIAIEGRATDAQLAEHGKAMLTAKPRRTKVAIVGFTPTRDQAPYPNPDFEIWALNDLFEAIPRVDRLFQIHSRQSIDTYTTRGEKASYIERLRALPVPIYMTEVHPDIPNSVKYPLEEMIAEFGGYFTNTISYMLALAIHEGFHEIHVYGVDMAVGTEFMGQRPSCEYFLGIAKGKGIRLYIPYQSDLLKSRFLYGFQEDEEIAFNKKCESSVKMMRERHAQAAKQERAVADAALRYDGGIQVLGEVIKNCKDEATVAKLNATMAAMHRDKAKREEQISQIHDVVCKYEGAIQAIGEIQKTWATCLANPEPFDVVAPNGVPLEAAV